MIGWATISKALFGISTTAILIVACGSGSSADDSGSFAQQYCDTLGNTCCAKFGQTYSAQTCTTFLSAAAAQGTYNASAGASCLDAVKTAAAQPNFCDDLGGSTFDAACANVFTAAGGTAAPGAPCKSDSDCATQTDGPVSCDSDYSNGATTETCVVHTHAKQGDDCFGTQTPSSDNFGSGGAPDPSHVPFCWTADGVYCGLAKDASGALTAQKKCAKIGATGEACNYGDSSSCVDGNYCNANTSTCAPLVALGGDCPSFDSCVKGAHCDQTSRKCVATTPAGAACTKDEECGQNNSCTNGKCQSSGLSTIFLCK